MRYGTLPGIAARPSLIGLGVGAFGSSIPRDRSFAILDAFAEAGGNFVDTAHVYAAWLPEGKGASERTLGAWLKARGVSERFVVGTKGGHPDLSTMHISRLSPVEITQDLNESLERLDASSVDLYWLHRDDPTVPVGEILGVLNEHIAAGRVRAIGASNWTVQRLDEAEEYARAGGLVGFCASQIGYSLAHAETRKVAWAGMLYADAPTLDYHRRRHLPLVAYSSQAQGFFSGRYGPDLPARNQNMHDLYYSSDNFGRLKRVTEMAAERGTSPNAIALAYLLAQPFPTYALVGSRNEEQIRDSVTAADIQLSDEEVAWLERGEPSRIG
jgi:aryl-alcohol dehydrogenase-like predicted oxidoreductase